MFEQFKGRLESDSIFAFLTPEEIRNLRVDRGNDCKTVFWDPKVQKYTELKDFLFKTDHRNGIVLDNGSMIMAEAWINVVMGADDYYHLVPLSGNFGFHNGFLSPGFNFKEQAYIVDEEQRIFYKVSFSYFKGNPYAGFSGERTMVFKGQEEKGMIRENGDFCEFNKKYTAKTIVHPAAWYLMGLNQNK
ncbi:MAG: hypothetical protein PHP97_03325 [Candidatus Shapirobacteria bacterium]|nr:hypothetical protein [Candidatus Shapirobacteria bacterium]MDD3002647.1 hypothetical protein [Candidatus Shapirobacteria bacterium]MDD4382828.1 hypothetical protein [Candidatus Shapirobacteria bacterium]